MTDENVPDTDKKRYALSLSIHGIERAGVEGGTRAMEELVTAVADGPRRRPDPPRGRSRASAPTFAEVLQNTIIYFTFPNPDGWRRGSVDAEGRRLLPALQRQRRRPEPRLAGHRLLVPRLQRRLGARDARASRPSTARSRADGGEFAAGDDLHGQPFADALSYTLMPHGRHDLDKDSASARRRS